ncbi:MAG: pyridoxamine 5'-phosphate oxidase family protein [Acidimicrobiia bacterium]|nr:pyridoxamine 5'-phosphate oxidase family protein [Acidimicrobiia bacterium]
MTMEVALDDLAAEISARGHRAFLTTVSDDASPKVTHVAIEMQGDTLAVSVGAGTAHNASARPTVTLLWPATEPGQLHLLVDGTAAVADGGEVVITPTWAVQHRIA